MPAPSGRFTKVTAPDVSFAGQYRLNDPRRSEDFGHMFGVSDYYFEERQLNDFRNAGQAPPGGALKPLKQQERPSSWACSRSMAAEQKAKAAEPSNLLMKRSSGGHRGGPKSDAGTDHTSTTRTSSCGQNVGRRKMSMREALADNASSLLEARSPSNSTASSPCKSQIASAKPGWEWCTMRQAVRPMKSEPAGCELGLVHTPGAYHHSMQSNKLQKPRSEPNLLLSAGGNQSSSRENSNVSVSSPMSQRSQSQVGARRGRGRNGQFETSMELSHAPMDRKHYRESLASQPPRWHNDKGFASFKL